MQKTNKVLGAVATVTIFSVFTRILSFLFKIYLSRALGAEAIGLYQIALSVFFLFASLSATGIPLVLSRKTAEHLALKKEDNFSLFSSALLLGVVISLVCIGILAIIGDKIDRIFSDPLAYPLFVIMLPALLSTSIYGCIRGWFWGKKEFKIFSITETVEEIFQILFGILFTSGIFASLSGAKALSVALTVSDIVVAIILLILFFAKGGGVSRPTQIKEIVTPSLPITAMRVFASLVGTLIALILPAKLMENGMTLSEATASFGRITGMANPLLYAPNAIIGSLAVVLIPEMSANGIKKEYTKLNSHLNNGINFSFLISGAFMVVYIALGEQITTIIFDDAVSGKYLQFASYVMLPMSVMQLTQSAINSIGKEFSAFLNYLIGNIFMVIAIAVLPKYVGIYAVAIASMLGMLIISVLNIYTLKKATHFNLSFIKYLMTVILFIFPCSYIAYATNGIISRFVPYLGVIIGSILSVLTYIVLCYIAKLVDVKGFIKLRKQKPA